MKKQNLETAQKVIIDSLNISKIEEIDKVELMINVLHFLNKDEYEENIRILQDAKLKRKTICELRREMFDLMPWEEEPKTKKKK